MSQVTSEKGVVQSSDGTRKNIAGVVFTIDDVTATFPKAGPQEIYLPLAAAQDIRPGDQITANFNEFGRVTSVLSKSGRLWKVELVTVYH